MKLLTKFVNTKKRFDRNRLSSCTQRFLSGTARYISQKSHLGFSLFQGTRTYTGRTARISIWEMCMLGPPFPDGVHKRPRRLTAEDRGLAQALQYERPARVANKPLSEIHNVKPSEPSPAGMKRPKRGSAGLRGLLLSAGNSKSAPRVSPKKQKTVDLHGVRTRSTAKKASKKNRKIGDLY